MGFRSIKPVQAAQEIIDYRIISNPPEPVIFTMAGADTQEAIREHPGAYRTIGDPTMATPESSKEDGVRQHGRTQKGSATHGSNGWLAELEVF